MSEQENKVGKRKKYMIGIIVILLLAAIPIAICEYYFRFQNQEGGEIERGFRPEISVENTEGGKLHIKVDNMDKAYEKDLPVFNFIIKYDQNKKMENIFACTVTAPPEGNGDEITLSHFEVGKTYYVKLKCDVGDKDTRWSKIRKIKIEK